MIVAGDYHSLVLDIWSLCHVFLLLSRSCNNLFCFPTMLGMDDVIFLFYHVQIFGISPLGWVNESIMVYPHLVGRWMYESVVIGRSFMMYRVMFFL